MRSLRLGLLTGVLFAFAPMALAQTPPAPDNVRQLLQDRNYDAALAAIDVATAAEGAPRDYLSYLKGRALHLQAKYDEAIEVFQQVEQQFPESPWARRARFAQGLSLARKGDFQSAELIYRQEAAWLLSNARKQEIADIYLEFAETYFKPKEETTPPDYQKALSFYLQALDVGPEPEKRVEIELLVAQCLQALANYPEAVDRLTRFVKEHPGAPQEIEARYRLGECQLALGQPLEARRTWQDLLADRPNDEAERLPQAAFHLSTTFGLPSPATDEDLNLGVAALEEFLARYADHALASQAHLRIAQSYVARGRYEESVQALQRYLADARYADRDETPLARNLLGGALQAQKKFPEALVAWREFLAKHPAHEAWSGVQQQIIQAEYLMGYEERLAKRYDPARELWTAFLSRYPLDPRSPGILYEFGAMLHEQKEYEAAIADWRRLVSKYPGTEEASQAQYAIAGTLEEHLGQLEEALAEYRKVTWGGAAARAQERIHLLTAKSLAIATPRVFRSDETPRIVLTTRNVESVTVRAYSVDLETYFRKMHLAQGVEGLDIALIDPDASFEFTVADYADHKPIESQIEVPLPRAGAAGAAPSGVLAVTVSGKTLEATTMVVQSDLDVIVKGSRDEVFVFAENMRTGEPWAGARLLISNGSAVFAEGETGADGVFQHDYKELREAADVRVFAVADGSVASNVVGLDGLGVATGLSDKGYIYTDRPAYRAGQVVHVRGVIRRASGDAYTIEAGRKHTLDIYDPRGRLLRQENVALGEFGGFHAHFILPRSAPAGGYRVQVRDDEQRSYEGAFTVQDYQLEPVRLTVDTPRKVYYRGEEIEGTIKASFYYGAPLADREIRYQLAGGRVETAVTDRRGEVHFKLPTREFREAQALPLVVLLPERNLQTAVNFYLATQGFSIGVATVRDVYVAGETFEVTLKTTDAEGLPTAQALAVNVVERTRVDGQIGERQVERHEVSTGEDGVGRLTLRLEAGAEYVVRALGTDRFENPISGEKVVQISDDKDTVRLRILADRHTYRVGDTATVRLHWRDEPALALVTYQGARVLGYRLVHLQNGSNDLEIPLTAALAPNFDLSVAAMTDVRDGADPERPIVRFHEATSPFTVERGLNVAIQPRRAAGEGAPLPGEDIEVVVTTTDPQGNPVSAEVSLAMVEQALLERFGSQVVPIDQFFHGGQRQAAVRTTSSITFYYNPTTQPIARALLAERERLELEEQEAASLELLVEAGSVSQNWAADMPAEMPAAAEYEELSGLAATGRVLSDLAEEGQAQDGFGYALNGQAGAAGRFAGEKADAFYRSAGGVMLGDTEALGKHFAEFNGPSGGGLPPTAENLYRLGIERRGEVIVLSRDGAQTRLTFDVDGDLGTVDFLQVAERLADAGAVLIPGDASGETAYWNPAIVTDDAGQAVVAFTLPERSTSWRLTAAGITVETMAGQTTQDLAVKKDLFGELKLPLAFTDGDQAEILASVHNSALDQGDITVTLRTTIGGKTVEEKKTLAVTEQGIQELSFRATIARPAEVATDSADLSVAFELVVAAGDRQDVVRRVVPLRPYGIRVAATASGSAQSDTTAWVEAPADMPLTAPHLQVLVGPNVERSLLDIVLGPAPWCQTDSFQLASGLDTTTSDLMASLALQKLLAGTRQAGGPQALALDARVRSALSLLVSSQNDDGGWSWTGGAGSSHRLSSARALWAVSLAKDAGYAVPQDALDRAIALLAGQIAASAENDYETRAVLLHALSTVGQGDFALANRLYRSRPALSNAALAHLALAFIEMDRAPNAQDLLALLAERDLDATATRRLEANGSLPWNQSAVEVRALFALAVQQTAPDSPPAAELVDWLMAHRTGHRWSPDKATGPAAMAVCDWFAEKRFTNEKYTLTVFVNDRRAAVLELGEDAGPQTIEVPDELLQAEGKQRINFQLAGRGRYAYQCILGGFVAADQLKNTTADWNVRRTYEPAPLELDGQEIPRGFGILAGNFSAFRNPLTQLPVGKRGRVELEIWRANVPAGVPEDQLEYLVVTEPLPSGTTAIESSVQGGFERFEISDGAITFYIGSRQWIETIRYDVHGYLPGEYRAAPTVIRNAYRPDQLAVSETKSLAVLPLGKQSGDDYRLSPQELYELGRRWFDKGDLPRAGVHLTELLANWNPNPDVYRDAARMLLDVSLAAGKPADIVRYFEIIKEKWSDLEIPFAKIVLVGAAYHEMGEYERSYLIFRATVESSFLRESRVAGFLEAQSEFTRSVDVMNRLLREYPPEPYLAAATYALSQRVYAKAPEAAADQKLREQKVNRVVLIKRAVDMLDAFLTEYPDDPAADQASFALANGLLDLKLYEAAIARCNRFVERYPQSDFLDSYWFIVGFSHFALSQHEEAQAMCRRVSETPRVDPASGREIESPNKWQAVYIQGQVHHSLGQAADAIREYRRVEERFPDARQAIEYFARKDIALPEVTTVRPGEAAQALLSFRNVARCDVRVYRIDLMKFSLLKRNLGGITQINLAGIRPYHEATIELGDGQDYRDRTHAIPLPLEDEGAYLVVCRGDDLHASGLVLVTPLEVEVREEAASGQLRATVKDAAADRFLPDVHVKVIGSRNDDFVSGETDLRGVFVADAIQGTSTVIAQAEGDRYAFFRGQLELGPPPADAAAPQQDPGNAAPGQSAGDGESLLDAVRGRNSAIQQEQQQQLKNLYEQDKKGVDASDAY